MLPTEVVPVPADFKKVPMLLNTGTPPCQNIEPSNWASNVPVPRLLNTPGPDPALDQLELAVGPGRRGRVVDRAPEYFCPRRAHGDAAVRIRDTEALLRTPHPR